MSKRILSLLLSVLLLFCSFTVLASCQKDTISEPNDSPGASEPDTSDSEPLPSELTVIRQGICDYVAVYSSALSEETQAMIRALFEEYAQLLGITIFVRSDTELPSPSDSPEILIGLTNRAQSQAAQRYLRQGESLLTLASDQSVLLLGSDDSATLSAARRFWTKYADLTEKTLILPFELYDSGDVHYALQSVRINGTHLMEYRLVLPEDADLSTQYAAVNFNDYLARHMGKTLTQVTDAEAPTQYEILLGNTNRSESALSISLAEGEYVLMEKQDKIVMQGNGIYVGAAVGSFIAQYLEGRGVDRTVQIDDLDTNARAKVFSFPKQAKNAILMIGDGMGFAQIDMSLQNGLDAFVAQQLPHQGEAITNSLSGTTDSAAAATALATGYKTTNGRIGQDENGNDLLNLRELAHSVGAQTAVLTTITIDHATPAAFLAHANNRNDTQIIQAQIQALKENKEIDYCEESPDAEMRLAEDTRTALLAINDSNDPFFMMVEEAHIDGGGHGNSYDRTISTVTRFNEAIAYVIQFVFCNPDTMLVITADHETGGLTADDTNEHGYRFTTTGHTPVNVPIYAIGAQSEYFSGATIEHIATSQYIATIFGDDSFGQPD